jgi:hypothetical protein
MVFLSPEKALMDAFLTATPNLFQEIGGLPDSLLEQHYRRKNPVNMLISSYEVRSRARDVFKAAILEEQTPNRAVRLWDVCEAAGQKPLVLRHEPAINVKGEDRFDIVGKMSVSLMLDSTYADISVIAPQDGAAFRALMNYNLGTDPIVAVPENADLDSVEMLLRAIENDAESDLTQIGEILKVVPWLYAVQRNCQDWTYSLFVARDTEIVRQVAQPNPVKGRRLFACL